MTTDSATAPAGPVAACVKWVDLRPQVDAVHGTVTPSERGGGFSPADRAALEVAIRLAEAWGTEVALVCAGPPAADRGLLDLAASGAHHVVRIDQSGRLPSAIAADVLATVLGPGDLAASAVVCGDLSYDQGSGAVPALLAHHLQYAQALGLIEVNPRGTEAVEVVRRLDGARRERLNVRGPSVLSVEGSVGPLRRAPLTATIRGAADVRAAAVQVRSGRIETHVEPPRMRPWRPRARVLSPPAGDEAFDRIVALTGALVDRNPPRTVEADPEEAAELIVSALRDWGYVGPGRGPGTAGTDGKAAEDGP